MARKNNLAPAPPAPAQLNALAPPPATDAAANPYIASLIAKATKDYPFINQHNPFVFMGNDPTRDYAETWPSDEEGTPDRPRPKELPAGRVGVQVFRPNDFGPNDLAAEFLHIDPVANETRASLRASLTPAQIERLKYTSRDYQSTLDRGENEDRAIQNAIDSALRGYTVGQWPAEANTAMGYSPQQLHLLENLKRYMRTGKK
jgi:hypothetical protein